MFYLYIIVFVNIGVFFKLRNFDSFWINIIKDIILNLFGGIVIVFLVMLDLLVFIYILFISLSFLVILKIWFLI